MRKVLVVLLLFTLSINLEAAQAATKTIKIKSDASGTISTSLSLPAKDECRQISFKYSISDVYWYPQAFTIYRIANKSGSEIGKTVIEQGNDYDADGNKAFVPFVGKSSIKVCGFSWNTLNEEGNGDNFIAVKKGTYYFSIDFYRISEFSIKTSTKLAVTFK